jgi:DNA polymerase-3 subunit alpha
MKNEYVSLHTHFDYSIGDSVIKVPDAVTKAVKGGQKAIATSDHGNLSSWLQFNDECEKQKIKPLFGVEFYCVDNYEKKKNVAREHLLLIAKDEIGLRQIQELNVISNQNHHYRPLIEYQMLENLIPGHLICTTACGFGRFGQMIINNASMNELEDKYYWFTNIFNDDFYLELQPHFYSEFEDQHRINEELINLSDYVSGKLIITTDAHYLNEGKRKVRVLRQAIAYKISRDEQLNSQYKTLSSNYYCSTFKEIQDLINKYNNNVKKYTDIGIINDDILKKSCQHTVEAANKCQNDIFLKYEKRIPEFTEEEQDKLLTLLNIEV